jgi:hypothetical protein
MNPRKTTIAIVATLSVSFALADDFKTNNGKEYKNAIVTHVEADGIVVRTKTGISKLYFAELPKEVQQRFNYDPQRAAAYSAEQNAAIQKNAQQFATEQADAQWMKQQQQDAASLQVRLQVLQQEKYNTMEHIRAVSTAPEYVGRSLNSVKADLPVLHDHLDDVNREIKSIKDQLQGTQH